MMNNSLSERASKRASKIQESINNQQPLLSAVAQTGSDWSQFMSCICAIQCTEYVLEVYCAETSNQTPIEEGKAFLLVYGVFQALFIQQDAVTNLCRSLRSLNISNLNDSHIKETLDGFCPSSHLHHRFLPIRIQCALSKMHTLAARCGHNTQRAIVR